jgi:hypothetical protein
MSSVDCEALRALEMPNFNVTYVGPEVRPVGAFIDWIIFWMNSTFLVLSLVIFAMAKYAVVPHSSIYWRYLDVRFFPLIIVVHIGAFLPLLCGSLGTITAKGEFPCWLSMVVILAPGLIGIPPAMRLFNFSKQYKISQASSQASRIVKARPHAASLDSAELSDDVHNPQITWKSLILTHFGITTLKTPNGRDSVVSEGTTEIEARTQDEEIIASLKAYKTLSSGRATMLIMFLWFLPYLTALIISIAVSQFARNGCATCSLYDLPILRFLLYVGGAIPVAYCLASVWVVRKAPDPLFVAREIKVAFTYFGLPSILFLILSGVLPQNLDFSFRFLYQLTLLGFCLVQSAIPGLVVTYWYYKESRKRSISTEVAHSSSASHGRDRTEFENTIRDPILHAAFMGHLTAEHAVESLRFHDEVTKWAREFHDYSARNARLRARKIVTLFVGDDAVFSVNLPYDVMHKLRVSVGVEESKSTLPNRNLDEGGFVLDAHFFDEADKEILELMRLDGFARFQETKRYKDIVSGSLKKEFGAKNAIPMSSALVSNAED